MPQLRRKSLTTISTWVANGSLPLLDSNTSITFGHDVDHHAGHDAEADDRQHDRVEHRAEHLLARHLAVLGVVGQALEHAVEAAGALAGGHRGAVDLREHLAGIPPKPSASVWPSMTLRAHAEHDALHARLLGLLGHGEQRFFERQAGLDQRGELAREQRQVGGGDAAPQREAAVALRFAVFDLGDGDRQQLPLAQQLAHVLDGVAFDDAVLFAARGVESGVFEGAHGQD